MPGIDLSLEKAAQFFGVDPRTVSRWVRDGCPATKDSKGRWTLNSSATSDWRVNRERESALGELSQVGEQEARRRKIAAEAALAEHELAIKQGAAVGVADFEAQMAAMIGAARAKLLNLGSKIAPLAFAASNVSEAKEIIDNSTAEVLAELSEFDGDVQNDAAGAAEPEGGSPESGEAVGAAAGSDGKRVGGRRKKAQS